MALLGSLQGCTSSQQETPGAGVVQSDASVEVTEAETPDTTGDEAQQEPPVPDAGVVPTEKLPTPQFSVPGGQYHDVTVAIYSTVQGVAIRYTLDGTEPTPSSLVYTSPFTFGCPGDTTLKAFSQLEGFLDSNIATATYSLYCYLQEQASPPEFSPQPGTYSGPLQVTMSAPSYCQVYYTTDGSTPDLGSLLYAAPLSITTTTVFRAISIDPAAVMLPSSVTDATYVIPP